jgi:EmrB/QacA subfamily drug resistance transporter
VSSDQGHPRRWWILGVLVLALLVVVLDHTILNVALRVLADPVVGLGATQGELAWAVSAYTLVFAGLLFTLGAVGDAWGHRRILILGLLGFGLASALSAAAQNPAQLIAGRAAMGVGAAAIMPQTLAILIRVFPSERRGQAIGIWASAVGFGTLLGPLVGGALLTTFWWGAIFLVNVPVVLLTAGMVMALAPQTRNAGPARLDLVGLALSVVGLGGLVYAIIEVGEGRGAVGADAALALVVGLGALAAFCVHETRASAPALDVRLFRTPRFSAALTVIVLVFLATAGTVFLMTFYLQSVRGLSPLHAGLATTPIAAGQVFGSLLSAWLVRRFGARIVACTGVLLLGAALCAYTALTVETPLVGLGVAFLAQGVGMGLAMMPTTDAVMAASPPEHVGAASAVHNAARQVATALGVAVMGTLASLTYREQVTPHLDMLPRRVREDASASIEETLAVAREVGQADEGLVEAARHAFMAGMQTSALAGVGIALSAAVAVLVWLPGRVHLNRPDPPEKPPRSSTGR